MTVIVAGGGLAGAAAATALAQAGVAVTLFEREISPADKICGEFVSFEAQTYLKLLGLDVTALGGHAITHVRLVRSAKTITAALPFPAIGLSRKVLDEALLNQAVASGAILMRGQNIRKINPDNKVILENSEINAKTLFLATGKHELHGQKRKKNPPDIVGFKMYFTLAPEQQAALAGHVELILFPGGYGGLQLVENNRANFCFLVESAALKYAGGKWPDILADLCKASPHLAARLAGAIPLLGVPLSIARVPYGFIYQAQKQDTAACFRLGDQAAVIQSFTGDGMSIALHSAALAVQTYLRGQSSFQYHQIFAADITSQIERATMIYNLLNKPLTQTAIFIILKRWPALLAIAANFTRIPNKALLWNKGSQNQQNQNHQQRQPQAAAII